MQNSLCITGVGSVTSIGLSGPSTAAAARAGIANFHEHPQLADGSGEPYVLAMVPALLPETKGADRYLQLALPALKEALAPVTGLDGQPQEIMAAIGLPEDRPGKPQDLEQILREEISKTATKDYLMTKTELIARGHAAGLMAVESAGWDLGSRSCEFCIIGGVDSYIDPTTLRWLEENDQLHTSLNAWGFIPGEAAGFCLVCLEETAEKYSLPIRARVVAAATARERNRIKTESVCLGQGLTEAVKRCVVELPPDCAVDYTICDQNGEAYRADEFGFMLARLSEHFADSSNYMTPADCWGDVGAASGPLFINLLIAAAEKGYGAGRHTLLWTSSEGGERSAAILQAEIRVRD